MNLNNRNGGFTLVEILLSLSLLSMMLVLLVSMVGMLTQMRETAHAETVLQQDGLRITESINRVGRNAGSLITPSVQTQSTTLSVSVYDQAQSPTIFSVSNGLLTIKKGNAAPLAIHSTMTSVSGFECSNSSLANTPGSLDCTIEMHYVNTSNKGYLNKTKTFYAAVTLR